jgi:hypothetical protein
MVGKASVKRVIRPVFINVMMDIEKELVKEAKSPTCRFWILYSAFM